MKPESVKQENEICENTKLTSDFESEAKKEQKYQCSESEDLAKSTSLIFPKCHYLTHLFAVRFVIIIMSAIYLLHSVVLIIQWA